MASLRSIIKAFKSNNKTLQIQETPNKINTTILKPLMVAYNIELSIEGQIYIPLIEKLINSLFLAWLLDLFKESPEWDGGLGYLWKSMRDNVLEALNFHTSNSETCHMLSSSLKFMGFTDGSCVSSEYNTKQFKGERSWELMSNDNHLIIITLSYQVTLQTFSHNQRQSLRDNGFMKLGILIPEEADLLKYMGVKHSKPYYTHEMSFEKLLKKIKGPKSPRVRAVVHNHTSFNVEPSAPPPYNEDDDDTPD